MSEQSYTLTGPAFAHVKSALMLAALDLVLMGSSFTEEIEAALDSLDTAVCSPVEENEEPQRTGEQKERILAAYRAVGIVGAAHGHDPHP